MGWLKRWRKSRSGGGSAVLSPAADPTFAALARTRSALVGLFRSMTGGERVGARFWEDLEEALIASDMGVEISSELVAAVRKAMPTDRAAARSLLADEVLTLFSPANRNLEWEANGSPGIMMVVGVNGAGKTTTAAKLAQWLKTQDHSCLLGAADTYRPAAQRQLAVWAEAMGVDMVGGKEGADPAAVARDAYSAAQNRGHQVVVIDTAGRLHSKTHLMKQLQKVKRVLVRAAGRVDEVLLVLDASTGQNGLAQAREFCERVGVTGVVLTKLDGTARGGVAVAVEKRLGVPIKLVGTGESLADLTPFAAETFVKGLLEEAPT